ncbi:MAG: endonuclease/exonuclease/phosphatase family protein [Mangrovicoccus sp.]|nr:endonuclease/exonuclease/phosphatase family protein [Mangrovicoccus sp.]
MSLAGIRRAGRRGGRGPGIPPGTRLRLHLTGILVPLVLALEAVAGLGRFVPDLDQFLSTNLRMLEHLAPHLLLLSLLLSLVVAGLGARRAGGALALLALLAGAGIVWDTRATRGPPAAESDLTLLWFNVLIANPTPPERLVAAIRAAGADVVLLAEATPLRRAVDGLADLYPYRLGCAEAGPCGLLLLSRFPVENPRFNDFPSGPERMLRVVLDVPGHGSVALVGLHETKPWYLGLTNGEAEAVRWGLRPGKRALPTVVAGDFNAAPWSLRMRRIQREQDLRSAAWPVPTWPAAAGRFGVPIDHVLVRDGTGIARLEPWGADLGSNHRGLLAGIDLP